jgi:hypothetical protein
MGPGSGPEIVIILWIWLGMTLFGVLAVAGAASALRNGGPPKDDYGERGTGEATRVTRCPEAPPDGDPEE